MLSDSNMGDKNESIKFSLAVIGTLLAVFILVGCASSPAEKL